MEFFDSTKSVIENIYYLSSILLFLSIIIGLVQLLQAKKILNINSSREAASIAAEQIEIYMYEIIPISNGVHKLKETNKVEDIDFDFNEFDKSNLINKFGIEKVESLMLNRASIILDLIKLLNATEAFAVYFTKGIADEEIAFSSIGESFCSMIKSYSFEISYLNTESNNWKNTQVLYNIWVKRIKATELKIENEKIKAELNKIKQEKLSPIGTD